MHNITFFLQIDTYHILHNKRDLNQQFSQMVIAPPSTLCKVSFLYLPIDDGNELPWDLQTIIV